MKEETLNKIIEDINDALWHLKNDKCNIDTKEKSWETYCGLDTKLIGYIRKIEKENKELQEQNKILQEKLNDAREYISTQKDEIKKLKELCDKYEEEHKTTFNEWKNDISKYQTLKNLQERIDKAIELIKNDDIIVKHQEFENKYTVNFYDRKKKLLNILEGKDE